MNNMFTLIQLYNDMKTVMGSDLSWEAKYDLIFSENCSRKFFELAPRFRYYDPDTSYQEDVEAFYNAVSEYL